MGYKNIKTELRDGLGTITLNRPPLNVLNIEMMDEINQVLQQWQGESKLKMILFNAEGKAFSAGVDVGEHMGELAPKMIETFHRMFRLLEGYEIPICASVFGSCLGGGCELAIFCDIVIASEGAKFGQPEIQVGVFPPIAVYLMPRIMPMKGAVDLILSGRIISAKEAMSLGLVNKVVKEEDLAKETKEFIKPYLRLSGAVLRITKRAIKGSISDPLDPTLKRIEDIYLNQLMKTHDANEGLQAFLDKRKPVWTDD
jgi:cyclohexa-1,5-dienecarbonyl-CoA hydratase